MTAKSWPLLLLFVIGIAPIMPNWLTPSLPNTHEHFRYLLIGDWFVEALRAGIWYPRWLPQMNGGFGYPQFVFYQPAYFYVNALSSLFTDDLLVRQLLALSFIALAGSLGVYRLARCFVSRPYAVLAVAAFQLAPYVHINLYVRGDLSEWMALELAAWPLYFLHLFTRHADDDACVGKQFKAWVGLCLSIAIVCYCHPVAVMFVPPIMLLTGVACLAAHRSTAGRLGVRTMELFGAVLMGLVLSAPYWLTVATMKHMVNTDAALGAYFETWNNTTPLRYLLFGSFLPGASFNDHEFIGAPFVLLSLAGWWIGRRIPLIRWAGVGYLAMLFMLTPWAKSLWHIYPLKLLQFPWRLAVFAPLLQVVCMLGFKEMRPLSAAVRGAWLAGGMVLLAAWSFAGHRGFTPFEAIGPIGPPELSCLKSFAQSARPASIVTTLDAVEWLPKTAMREIASLPARGIPDPSPRCSQLQGRLAAVLAGKAAGMNFFPPAQPRPGLETAQGDWTVREGPLHTAFLLDYQLSGDMASTATINQLYLPGWAIAVNGRKIERQAIEGKLLPDGRMRLDLPAGTWRVQAWYDGPPGRRTRGLAILALCILVIIYWSFRLRTARVHTAPPTHP